MKYKTPPINFSNIDNIEERLNRYCRTCDCGSIECKDCIFNTITKVTPEQIKQFLEWEKQQVMK